ncbi:conserved domain protein [Streptococcus constellatus subsp. pharyngis SK1060 = CCUG 46377]|uniref:Conserved domain protein n=1 Tax=Streptococcus constellatus subsp. pharyngis SK1060 = CCUG 46377 TaxID=1035184 RepID=F9P9M0_STRCV|nr:conserved domain protein [Streptococcus constellatus subsp. pharyngis SK1060 = CCUG 46377]
MAAVAVMAYIYSLPNMDFIVMSISFIGTIALALWISFKFWK